MLPSCLAVALTLSTALQASARLHVRESIQLPTLSSVNLNRHSQSWFDIVNTILIANVSMEHANGWSAYPAQYVTMRGSYGGSLLPKKALAAHSEIAPGSFRNIQASINAEKAGEMHGLVIVRLVTAVHFIW